MHYASGNRVCNLAWSVSKPPERQPNAFYANETVSPTEPTYPNNFVKPGKNAAMNSAIIDANIAVYCVLPAPMHEVALRLLSELVQHEVMIYVPHLWLAEVTTSIRKISAAGQISSESSLLALDAALNLPVEVIQEDSAIYCNALRWAEKLGQSAVYDAIYLAVAEELSADFFTADRRLYHHCKESRIGFVKLLE